MPQINDRLGEDETLLNLLYDFLDHEPPLNPLLASFFSKTIGNLIARKTEQVNYLPNPCGLGWLMLTYLAVSHCWVTHIVSLWGTMFLTVLWDTCGAAWAADT